MLSLHSSSDSVKRRLTVILPTEASLEESSKIGLLSRWSFYFDYLSREFSLDVYSCDSKDYSATLHVMHHTLPYDFGFVPFGNQVAYNLLLLCSKRRFSEVVRVIGSSYFVLQFIGAEKKILLSYPYKYSETTRRDYGGIKGLTSFFRESRSVKSAHTIMATTKELQNYLSELYGRKSDLVPNFVDTTKFCPGDKKDIVLFAGRIVWQKGIDTLLHAFKAVQEKRGFLQLRIAGSGEIEHYRDVERKLNVRNVAFLGAVDNNRIAALFSEAKFFVFPSVNREGNPKALIEAMAAGCVCVASDVPGNNDLIEDSVNGFLFPPSDHCALYKVLDRLLADDELCASVSKRAVESSREFAIENTLEKELSLVKQLFASIRGQGVC